MVSAARTELQSVSNSNNKFNNQQSSKDLQSAEENLHKAYLEANQDYFQRQIDEIRKGNGTSSAWKAIHIITGRKRANKGQVKGRSQQERLDSR